MAAKHIFILPLVALCALLLLVKAQEDFCRYPPHKSLHICIIDTLAKCNKDIWRYIETTPAKLRAEQKRRKELDLVPIVVLPRYRDKKSCLEQNLRFKSRRNCCTVHCELDRCTWFEPDCWNKLHDSDDD